MILSKRDLLNRAKSRGKIPLNLDYEGLLKVLLGPDRRSGLMTGPRPTQRLYIESKAPFKAFKGEAGAAKTSGMMASAMLRALFQPNVQIAIGRLDYNDLLGTTAKRLEEMLNRLNPDLLLDRDKTPPMRWWIQQPVMDKEGNPGIAQIDFIGLKEYPGSYEWNRIYVDEADEVDKAIIDGLKSRLRAPCEPEYEGDYGLDIGFNPPDTTHWIYTACTGLDYKGNKVATPEFTLFDPKAGENAKGLPDDYLKRFEGMAPDMLARLKDNKWGTSFPGEAVFKDAFYSNLHVRDELAFDPSRPLILWMDFGFRHPVAIWTQMDEEHRFRLLHEMHKQDMEARDFIRGVHMETNINFPQARGKLYIGDPAAKQKKDTGSTLAVLAEEGVNLMYLEGMTIEEGLRRTRYVLSDFVRGEPRLLISRRGCPFTLRMFQGGYYKHKTTGKPVKDGFYDHHADAVRYGITNMVEPDGRPSALPDPDYEANLAELSGDARFPDNMSYQR
jgi:hypothetical protein